MNAPVDFLGEILSLQETRHRAEDIVLDQQRAQEFLLQLDVGDRRNRRSGVAVANFDESDGRDITHCGLSQSCRERDWLRRREEPKSTGENRPRSCLAAMYDHPT